MQYGLEDKEVQKICSVFKTNANIEKVILYGSRAKGNYKVGSDIDITLVGESLSEKDLRQVQLAIDDLSLIYTFDISLFSTLTNKNLIDHIERVGKIFWKKSSPTN